MIGYKAVMINWTVNVAQGEVAPKSLIRHSTEYKACEAEEGAPVALNKVVTSSGQNKSNDEIILITYE